MALGPGSIAFVGINTSTDWFAFVALEPISGGQVIYFTDNELAAAASTQFNGSPTGGESYTKWTAPAEGVAAGTVINFSTVDPISVNIGTAAPVTFAGSANRGLSNGQDSLYAYTAASDATVDTPAAHLAFISIGNAADIAPASLAANQKIVFTTGEDAAAYMGPHDNKGTFAAYLDEINNPANWTKAATIDNSSLNTNAFVLDTPPALSSSTPADGAADVPLSANILLVFSENVVKGSGSILIKNVSGDSVAQTIDVSSGAVSVSGNTVTVNPPADLAASHAYYVELASGVIKDSTGNDFAGISGSTALNFTTAASESQSVAFANGSLAVSHNEGQSGTADFSFTVERTGGTTGDIDFSGTFASAGTDNADYGGGKPVSFSGTILAGQSTGTATIHVAGDTMAENNESFTLTLDTVSNNNAGVTAGLGSAIAATGTILDDDTPHGIDLSSYVRIGRFDLPEPTRTAAPANSLLAQEVSAVTYNWDTDTLFVVGDGGTSVVQVTKTGQIIDSMTLAPGGSPQGTDFYDTEGLTYIGGGKFVMTEERDRQAVEFTYAPGTTLTRGDALTVKLGTFAGNMGLEGLSYDPQSGGYIFVKEVSPESIFQTGIDFAAGTATNGSPTAENSIDLFDPALAHLTDFADVYSLSNLPFLNGQADQSHLLILSQEDGKIVNIDRSGHISSTLTIVSDPGNPLSVPNQQHEGLTMDFGGNLYVVSENGGGDFDHPQLWVYALSSVPNQAPTAIALTNQVAGIEENSSTTVRVKIADVAITDDGLGTNTLYLTGPDAGFFDVDSNGLYIKAGTVLDYETKNSYSITVNVDDTSVGSTPDATTPFTLAVTNVVNEDPAHPTLYISEVAPWSSGNSPVGADWFEVTNTGSSAVDITGWKLDDNSNSFGSAVALNGITSIAPGESVIFIETNDLPGRTAAFVSDWFGGAAPAGLHIGSYTGGGVGLSTGGDTVNLYNGSGALQASVSFDASPIASPFATFNNAAGLNNAAITTISAVRANGAFAVTHDVSGVSTTEIGSPGTIGKLFVSEVAAWGSSRAPVSDDWFEVTNSTPFAVDITGWKVDDNSGSFAAAIALNGITSIAPGESVIFIETTAGHTAASDRTAFLDTWFGGNPPANLQIGNYSGTGIGLSATADAVNLYNATGLLQASVSLGANAGFQTFDNAAGINNAAISQLSTVGVNAAFAAVNDTAEIGSPGETTPVNDPPVATDDGLASIAEDSGNRVISFASVTGNDLAGPANENSQSLTIIGAGNAVGGTVSIAGTNVIFAPAPNYNGPASFDYTVQDNGTSYGSNSFLTDIGSVSFTITPVNDAPVATDDPLSSIAEDSGDRTISFASLTANDSTGPANESGQSLTIIGVGNAVGGTVSISGTNVIFAPAPNYTGTASFDYTAQDNGTTNGANDFLSDVGAVSFAIVEANDAPLFTSSAAFSLLENTTAAGTVAATDPEGDAFTFAVTGGADQAFFSIDSHTGALTFVGSPDFETPQDANRDNVYDVVVSAEDVHGAANSQQLSIAVTDAAEPGKTIVGTKGNDVLTGTTGNDEIIGGNGNDRLDAGDGSDNLSAGSGNDTLIGGRGNDLLDGRAGNGNDQLLGGGGNDTAVGGAGNDSLDGGTGNNQLAGDAGDDLLSAGDDDNSLDGGAGSDTVVSGGGDNTVIGGAGNDALSAGDGDNTLDGGTGDDIFGLGNGNNLVSGNNGDDVVTAGDGENTVDGGTGDDSVDVGDGANVLTGAAGNDSLTAGSGDDSLNGGAGSDALTAGAGSDSLDGGAGVDRLDGGAGADLLTGGAAADTFVFKPGDLATGPVFDEITDFSHAQHDKIDVSALDAVNGGADNAFSFIGAGAFTGSAGQLHYVANIGGVIVEGDTNGDAVADFHLVVDGVASLAVGDFWL